MPQLHVPLPLCRTEHGFGIGIRGEDDIHQIKKSEIKTPERAYTRESGVIKRPPCDTPMPYMTPMPYIEPQDAF